MNFAAAQSAFFRCGIAVLLMTACATGGPLARLCSDEVDGARSRHRSAIG